MYNRKTHESFSFCVIVYFLLLQLLLSLSLSQEENRDREFELVASSRKVVVKNCRHGYFILNSHDTVITRSLLYYGEWEERIVQLLLRLVEPGDIVIDGGANIGALSIPLAKRVGPNGMVHSFEAQRKLHNYLCANIAFSGLNNVATYRVLLGSGPNPSQKKIPCVNYSVPNNWGAFSFIHNFTEYVDNSMLETIDVIPLDTIDFYNSKTGQYCPRLIKLDVESMEIEVLRGGRSLIQACRPYLFLENNDENKAAALINFLYDEIQYTPHWVLEHSYPYENFRMNETIMKDLLYTLADGRKVLFVGPNILCVPSEHIRREEIDPETGEVIVKGHITMDEGFNPVQKDKPAFSNLSVELIVILDADDLPEQSTEEQK